MIKQAMIFSFLFVIIAQIAAQNEDPVLFTVNDRPVYFSEFDYIYKKNNRDKADYSKESLQEYLDLYIKFKLKVEKAKELKLDTLEALQTELAGYRKQLASAYLVDKEVTNELIDEAYGRKMEDVKVRHILVSVPAKASKDRIAAAEEKIYNIKEKLNNGADFGMMAKTLSDDKRSAANEGELGWLTATLPNGFYALENAIYQTEANQPSQPIRTKIGYHIVEVLDKRPARGEIEVSHLLIRSKKNGIPNPEAHATADSIYELIKGGRSYDEMVQRHSDDKNTANKNGSLGFFGIGMYDPAFEQAAFSLKQDGDITAPVKSSIGWHIIRRDSKRDYSNEQKMKSKLKNSISTDDRFDTAKAAKIKQIQEAAGFSYDEAALQGFIAQLNESYYSFKWEMPVVADKDIASFPGYAAYTVQDFAEYSKRNTKKRLRFDKTIPLQESVGEMFDAFIEEKTLSFEEANLEQKYPDFRALMREYSEGVLLFEVTKDNVWDKASRDTVGLKEFHSRHRDDYVWKDRLVLDEYIIETTDKGILRQVNKLAEKMTAEEVKAKIAEDHGQTVFVERHTYEKGDDKLRGIKWKKGHKEVRMDQVNKESKVIIVREVLPAAQKTLKEAKGYIIADYQDELEQKWVQSLREQYPVDIKENVLSTMVQ